MKHKIPNASTDQILFGNSIIFMRHLQISILDNLLEEALKYKN